MVDRKKLEQQFLQHYNWDDAKQDPITQDASFRSYKRLTKDGESRILMDAPPAKEDVTPFIDIDRGLRRRGLNAPIVYAVDEKHGFLLLEDFGDNSFTKVLGGSSPLSEKYDELTLYTEAVDVLIYLHNTDLPRKAPSYDDNLLRTETVLLTDWYLPQMMDDYHDGIKVEYLGLWETLYAKRGLEKDVLVLRDYHADNLMWLPERDGLSKVGLLDFQDAVIGSPVYDMVSLLEDARRDVSEEVVEAMLQRYLDAYPSMDKERYQESYAIMAAQRNCKIIGIFARLAIRDGKLKYLQYIPRVWRLLRKDLEHPVLSDLSDWFSKVLPDVNDPISKFETLSTSKSKANV